jgi:hypothetical protein
MAALNTEYVPGVIVYLDPAAVKDVAGLSGAVTVTGLCTGTRPDPSTVPEFVVILEGCARVRGK